MGDEAIEGAIGGLVDRGVGKLADSLAPIGTQVGKTRFKYLGKDADFAKKIDPNMNDTVVGGKLIQALQPNVSEFDSSVTPSVVQSVKEARDNFGYFDDVSSIRDLGKKVWEDVGETGQGIKQLPNGQTVSFNQKIPGRLGKNIGDINAALGVAEKEQGLPGVPIDEVRNVIKIDADKFYNDRLSGVVSKDAYDKLVDDHYKILS